MLPEPSMIATLLAATAFGLWATVHVALAWGLMRRGPRYRGPVALLFAPLGLWWAMRGELRGRGYVWLATAVIYLGALVATLR